MQCPICGSISIDDFLHRHDVPVHQNLLISTQNAALNVVRGDLDMVVCEQCGFVFNRSFDPSKLSYGEAYENTQSYSTYFLNYMQEYVDWLVADCGVRNSRIVEVGCGKGVFLKMLVEPLEHNNTGDGYDPSYLGPLQMLGGRLRFHRQFYDASAVGTPADVVTCRHVIEHVQSPMQLLTSIRAALTKNVSARVFFETPCIEWMLRNQVVWDFFYEHCSLFSAASLRTAFQNAGFIVNSVTHVFEGQYLLLSATFDGHDEVVYTPAEIPNMAYEYARQEAKTIKAWKTKVERLANDGKVAVWGAGAKGNTFVNLVDRDRELIDCVIDVNPNKQGHFVPGTGHPIVGISQLTKRDIKNAILMNPNYQEEKLSLIVSEAASTQLIG